jgi:hypothetical protein
MKGKGDMHWVVIIKKYSFGFIIVIILFSVIPLSVYLTNIWNGNDLKLLH